MKLVSIKMKCALALVMAGCLAMGSAMADKPEWAGKGKGGKNNRQEQKVEQRDHNREASGGHFEERHTTIVRDYYGEQMRTGRCPPGLAKKNNGCMPPGQAKKWELGRPLPRDVIYYNVPQPVLVQIGPPPPGHRYIRVANDILMIALGKGTVVDAIRNFGQS